MKYAFGDKIVLKNGLQGTIAGTYILVQTNIGNKLITGYMVLLDKVILHTLGKNVDGDDNILPITSLPVHEDFIDADKTDPEYVIEMDEFQASVIIPLAKGQFRFLEIDDEHYVTKCTEGQIKKLDEDCLEATNGATFAWWTKAEWDANAKS